MDPIDNPDHGAKMYGIRVVNRSFDPNAVQGVSSVPPDGGPVFPATEDVEISSAPTN
jgi:hypothetical protein